MVESPDANARATRKDGKRIPPLRLTPARDILLITSDGPVQLAPEAVSTELVGRKAFGMSALPSAWVPEFFVVDSDLAASAHPDALQSLLAPHLMKLNP